MTNPKVIVVMPAYNAAATLYKTYKKIPREIVDTVILVDDASSDLTSKIALEIGLKVFRHVKNYGYGGNQKTCYTEALRAGADIVVMLHPDYQYDPALIPEMITPIANKEADIVLGSRFLTNDALSRGMPWWKYAGNRLLTSVENIALQSHLSEFHSGYRAYSRNFLQKTPFRDFSNNFVFDQELLISAIDQGYKIHEIAAPARYFDDSSSISFQNSVQYGLETLRAIIRHFLIRLKLPTKPLSPEPIEYYDQMRTN